jgi:hypothetical protein
MSLELADEAVTQFEEEMHLVFQPSVQDLRKHFRVKDCKGAKTVQFPVLGKSTSTERTNFHTKIPVGNASHDPVTCAVKNWTVAEYTDIFLNNQVNFDERTALQESLKMSLSRRMLQLPIDVLTAATITKTVASSIGGANTDLNTAKLREGAKKLNVDGVPAPDRTLMCHTNGVHALTGETDVKSSDFNTLQVLTKGNIDAYYGFMFLQVPDMTEGGLTLSSGDRTNFAFQKMAVGMAVNMEPAIEVWYDGDVGAHKVTGFLSANACLIDQLGIVEITTDENG